MNSFIKKIKKAIHSLDPTYETSKMLEKLNEQMQEYNTSMNTILIKEHDRLLNLTDDERTEEKEHALRIKANKILYQLESEPELYRVFNNILRKNKFKQIEDNTNE